MNIEGPDGGNIVIDRSVSNRPWGTNFVEVVGVVGPDRTIRESRSTDFGNEFGMLYICFHFPNSFNNADFFRSENVQRDGSVIKWSVEGSFRVNTIKLPECDYMSSFLEHD